MQASRLIACECNIEIRRQINLKTVAVSLKIKEAEKYYL